MQDSAAPAPMTRRAFPDRSRPKSLLTLLAEAEAHADMPSAMSASVRTIRIALASRRRVVDATGVVVSETRGRR